MSQSRDDKAASSRQPADASLPKRPTPTIDLKATEIKSEGKPATAPPSSESPLTPGVSTTGSADPKSRANPGSAASVSAAGPRSAASSLPPTGTVSASAASSSARSAGIADLPSPGTSAQSGGGFGRALGYLGAALLGGLLALLGSDYVGSMFGISSPNIENMSSRLAKLEASAQAFVARPDSSAVKAVSDQLAQTQERLARLESAGRQLAALSNAQQQLVETTKALESKIGAGGAPAAETSSRISKLEEALQGLATAAQAQPGQPIPELARLGAKLGELEIAIAALRKAGTGDVASQIEARLAEARKAEAQMGEVVAQLKTENAKRLQELEGVKTQAERLEQRLEAMRSDAGSARASVDGLKSDVASQLQTVARQADVKTLVDGVDKRVTGVESRIEAIAKRDAERQANSERIVVSLQLANLKRVLEQGRPYGEALAEVEKVASGLVDLGALKPHRDKGVLPTPELLAEFRKVTRTVLEAEQDKGQASTVERLLSSAKSVVQIRRTGGDVAGDTAEALLARAEHNLKAGDLVSASKEIKALKPELRIPVQGWIDQLEARVAVDRALGAIEDKLKTTIAGGPAGKGKTP